jgi:hypothetical protein
MHWRKLGQLYAPEPVHPKLLTHAANPLAVYLERDVYRVFFSGRDAQNRSSVGSVDVDLVRHKVVHRLADPAFVHGPADTYYSHGVSIGNAYEAGGRRYILFMGWQIRSDKHWRGEIGRLVLHPDLSLSLDGPEPFMAVDAHDPVSLSYPWVQRDETGAYQMWYGSTLTWDGGNGEMVHVINHAVSPDGHQWRRNGQVLPHTLGTAQAFSRPTVVGDGRRGYEMWFSYRSGTGEKYRIGYATSPDGTTWTLRLGESGIAPSPTGWDSEMIEYPFVFDHKGQRFMLYNGNDFGRTGFGLAVLV